MSCDVGKATEGLEIELELILQSFRHFTYVTTHFPTLPSLYLHHSSFSKPFRHFSYVTAHSPTLPSLYLRHNSLSNSSVASPRSQFILQPFFCFSYVTGSSLTSPGEPPMEIWIVTDKDEDKISGHSTVEQATTVSFTEMEEGVAPMPSAS